LAAGRSAVPGADRCQRWTARFEYGPLTGWRDAVHADPREGG
jgi:hypothetical protein